MLFPIPFPIFFNIGKYEPPKSKYAYATEWCIAEGKYIKATQDPNASEDDIEMLRLQSKTAHGIYEAVKGE